jgi:hypothetical protein
MAMVRKAWTTRPVVQLESESRGSERGRGFFVALFYASRHPAELLTWFGGFKARNLNFGPDLSELRPFEVEDYEQRLVFVLLRVRGMQNDPASETWRLLRILFLWIGSVPRDSAANSFNGELGH